MARLIIATGLDRQAQRHPRLGRFLGALEGAFMSLLWWGFHALSPERAARLGAALVRWIGPRTRKAPTVIGNLELAFPDRSADEIAELAKVTWSSIGAVGGEYAHLETLALADGGERIEVVDQADLSRYARRERGAVFFSAHLGNWEINALALARAGVPVMSLYASAQNERFARLLDRARAQLGCEMVPRDGSLRPVLKHLGARGSLGVLTDLRVADGVPMPFLGHDMDTSLVPARLALRFGCDVVPIRADRLRPGWFRVTVEAPLEPPASGSEDARALALTRAMNGRIETWIRERPGEWLCTNRRWAKDLYPHRRRAVQGR